MLNIIADSLFTEPDFQAQTTMDSDKAINAQQFKKNKT